jgi:hypothetical protein
MNQRESAAWEMHCFFDHLEVQYVIIGGLAVQHWGEPRFTQIEGIVYRQQNALDVSYIRRWLRDFADVLAKPEILEQFERPWRKIH